MNVQLGILGMRGECNITGIWGDLCLDHAAQRRTSEVYCPGAIVESYLNIGEGVGPE